jgi:hypothetical protein
MLDSIELHSQLAKLLHLAMLDSIELHSQLAKLLHLVNA